MGAVNFSIDRNLVNVLKEAIFELTIQLSLETGDYVLCASLAQPSADRMAGTQIDETPWLGPFQVRWNYDGEVPPFYGMVGLKAESVFFTKAENKGRTMHTFVSEKGWLRNIFKYIANIRTPLAHSYPNWEPKNYWLRLAGLSISNKGVAIDHGFQCLTGQEENILIDDYTAIGIGAKFWNFNEVRVGKFCMFAADVTLTNGGHDRNTFEPFSGPLIIGNGCWIGNGARIIGPLTVGDNAIIAAGAVVVNDVPACSIVGGVPAKVIGARNLPSKVWHLGNTYFCPRTFQVIGECV